MLRVAVDFGTSSTCTAVSVDGRAPQVVVVDGAPLMPSSVYLAADGTLFVGHEADRQAAVDPSRYEPHPKRRIDEPELLLGDAVLPVVGAVRGVLRRAVQEARRLAGGAPVDQLVLTHPADWGATRTQKLRRCAHGLATELVLIPEPVAAAVFHAQAHAVPDGGCLAVLDLGGGTVDASVVRRTGAGFRVLATRGDPNFGGADIDHALLGHVGARLPASDAPAWRSLVDGRELADRRRRRVLHQDVRGAKETLSRHAYADVPMPQPFPDAHVTRDDLERLIAEPMRRTVTLLEETIAEAGQPPVGVFLVGGSSRIPLVSRLLHERLGVFPVTLDQPETVVARGALHAVLAGPATAAPPQPAPGMYRSGPTQPAPVPPGRPVPPGPAVPPGLPVPHGAPPFAAHGTGASFASHPGGPALAASSAPPVRRSRVWWLVAGAVLAATAGSAALVVALTGDEHVAAYHYRFTVPDGWQRTGEQPDMRRIDLGPDAASLDRIIVKEFEVGYDAGADRDRAVDELRADYDRRRADANPPAFDGFDPDASFAGRAVLYYTERVEGGTVDWYVLFGGRYLVYVGCQHDGSGAERVRAACERVVRTLSVETKE